jgi:predicted enzyme related to lactoylglutathione lyase
MITRLSHAPIYVDDHDRALEFYVDTLGFEVRMDQTVGGFRWLTVAPKGQRETEIVLMEVGPSPMMDDATVAQLRDLLHKGALGAGVLEVDDCRATYESLSATGVEFLQEPTERPYGVEAVLRDPFGNWFSMTQPRSAG